MCEQDYENKKLVITKFSFFLQALNSNFRLSANRAYPWHKYRYINSNSRFYFIFYFYSFCKILTTCTQELNLGCFELPTILNYLKLFSLYALNVVFYLSVSSVFQEKNGAFKMRSLVWFLNKDLKVSSPDCRRTWTCIMCNLTHNRWTSDLTNNRWIKAEQ